jgi:hypothetical protein
MEFNGEFFAVGKFVGRLLYRRAVHNNNIHFSELIYIDRNGELDTGKLRGTFDRLVTDFKRIEPVVGSDSYDNIVLLSLF